MLYFTPKTLKGQVLAGLKLFSIHRETAHFSLKFESNNNP